MRPTPETDAVAFSALGVQRAHLQDVVQLDFARNLERSRDEAVELLRDMAEQLELALSRLGVCGQGDGKGRGADADAALEKARENEGRYLWLRDTANKSDIDATLLSGLPPHKIDAAIDAARAK